MNETELLKSKVTTRRVPLAKLVSRVSHEKKADSPGEFNSSI